MRNRQRRMTSERERVEGQMVTDGGRQRVGTWGDREGETEHGEGEMEHGER